MGFLKGLASTLMSLLLFLSLSVFSLLFLINQTVLNADFIASEFNKLDIRALAGDLITGQLPVAGGQSDYMIEVMDATIADLEPWANEQVGIIAGDTIDYLKGKTGSLDIVIPLGPLKSSLASNIRTAVLSSPPPELAVLTPAQVEQYIGEISGQLTRDMPASFHFSEEDFPDEAQSVIEQVRQVVSYFGIAFWGLIIFMLLLVLGIVLISRQVKSATRGLGITFLIYGALEYAFVYAAKRFLDSEMIPSGLPEYLNSYLPQLLADFMSPLVIFSIGLMAFGAVLIVISIVYRSEPSPVND